MNLHQLFNVTSNLLLRKIYIKKDKCITKPCHAHLNPIFQTRLWLDWKVPIFMPRERMFPYLWIWQDVKPKPLIATKNIQRSTPYNNAWDPRRETCIALEIYRCNAQLGGLHNQKLWIKILRKIPTFKNMYMFFNYD
jgi:hypothetical protein